MHPGWIVLMILGFIFWWPVGPGDPRLHHLEQEHGLSWRRALAAQDGSAWKRRWAACANAWSGFGGGFGPPSSGNHAFDEYRTETLRRLEEEQREFRDFLDRLRFAKDKAEFDQFMAERRNRPQPRRSAAAKLTPPQPRLRSGPFADKAGGPMRF